VNQDEIFSYNRAIDDAVAELESLMLSGGQRDRIISALKELKKETNA